VIGRLDLGDINLAPACRFISEPEEYLRLAHLLAPEHREGDRRSVAAKIE